MIRLLAIASFLLSFTCHGQVIVSNLIADFEAGNWVTNSDFTVSTWYDQHNTVNTVNPDGLTNDATEATPSYMPTWTNLWGNTLLSFNASVSHSATPYVTNRLATGPGLTFNAGTNTCYYVCTGPLSENVVQTMLKFTNSIYPWLEWGAHPANYPDGELTLLYPATLYPAMNLAVFVMNSSAVSNVWYWNYKAESHASLPTLTMTACEFGGALQGEPYGGFIKRVMIFKQAHSSSQVTQMVTALCQQYGIVTNYTRQAICTMDSMTAGLHDTNNLSWPVDCLIHNPDVAWYNLAIVGKQIGTNGAGGTAYTTDNTFVDTVFNASAAKTYLFMLGGINDIASGGLTGPQTYGRFTNYWQSRLAAAAYIPIVITLPDRATSTTAVSNLNNLIRSTAQTYYTNICDVGFGSPYESRLSNSADTTYFYSDGTHLVNAGNWVIAQYAYQFVNQPKRMTGFFAP